MALIKTFVVGNEKGGSGKTTTTMHIIACLLDLGFKVGSIDLDVSQQSITKYIDNRKAFVNNHKLNLPVPNHCILKVSSADSIKQRNQENHKSLIEVYKELAKTSDFIIMDTAGGNEFLSQIAHSMADIIITPINDSFIDLNLIGEVTNDLKIGKLGNYSGVIWEQKMKRAQNGVKDATDWIVIRNRLSSTNAKNKRNVKSVIDQLSKRLGFRYLDGFGERVIFRELFPEGLTIIDVIRNDVKIKTTMSHLSAKQELRKMLKFLNIPEISSKLTNLGVSRQKKTISEKLKSSAHDNV